MGAIICTKSDDNQYHGAPNVEKHRHFTRRKTDKIENKGSSKFKDSHIYSKSDVEPLRQKCC